ncbi:sensor domain-containing diguanylate cyclase [Marinomonas transparens]|uniref:Sensor domain-containing diguanylate cyclase n=1 Tax=Marinomonas transparens TaxID=2795388 RepID=A0A934MVQ2_9GAMM|nr:sensor domain-containing diguanylate cyclase [Marinomonas transparens]MBJ7537294.1 sensor domain-containing diguanylate cyclase [Marinomonas transparens]
MLTPKIPKNEAERLHALRTLQILDTSHEERFDRVTRMAKRMFGVPISLVSIVDENRQWFKSSQGLDATETPREVSFCGHAINQDGLFIVPNALEDERFFDNPLVTGSPNVCFYAGYPLKLRPGINLGTLCLIDSKPKILEEEDKLLLEDLGAMIEQEIKAIQLATLDELTMISNRRGFFSLAEHAQQVCIRKNMSMTFILFDLNDFKPINDLHGHHEGDFALIQFAEVMQNTFRESDVIGRLGGDEFVVMLSDTDAEEVKAILKQFDDAIIEMNQRIDKPYKVLCSAGVATFSSDISKSLDDMIEAADVAMYEHKSANKLKIS